MIYWVACAGHRSLPRWCPTAASVSLHPSSTPQGRPRYHDVVVALLLHLQVQKRQQQRFAVRSRLRRQDHFPLEIVLIYVFLLLPIEEKKGQHRATVATACFSLHSQFGRYQEEDKERKLWSERDKRVECLRGVDMKRVVCERIRDVCYYSVIKITCGLEKKQCSIYLVLTISYKA